MRLLTVLFLGAIGVSDGASPPKPSAIVRIVAREYAFQVPSEVEAGLVTIRFVNQGGQPHYARILRLASGKSLKDVVAWRESGGALPDWLVRSGGPATTTPGDSTEITLRLEPGTYALLCTYPTPAGVPHVALGMLAELRVGATIASDPHLRPDLVLQLADYSFTPIGNFRRGWQTIQIENGGRLVHQALLVNLPPGVKVKDELAWFRDGSRGPRPGIPRGGVIELVPGQRVWLRSYLPPGEYVLMCGVPHEDGLRHFDHGMSLRFAVR